jgi:RHS repeat-associated protein
VKNLQKFVSALLVVVILLTQSLTGYAQSALPQDNTKNQYLPVIYNTASTTATVVLGEAIESPIDDDNTITATEVTDTNNSLTVISAAPGNFGKTAPANTATNVATNATLSWQSATSAVGYGYCIDTTLDNRCDRGTDNYIRLNATSVILALEPGRTYQWQARAYAADGTWTPANGAGAWWSFSTNPNGPGPLGKIAPANGAANIATMVTLSWQTAQNATGYGYCIDTSLDNQCSFGIDNYVRLTGSSVILSLEPGKTYQWQARAYTADGSWMPANGAGGWWSFSTSATDTGPFSKTAPGNGATNVATNVTLSWQTSQNAVGYGYCIDTTLDAICDRGRDNYVRVSGTNVSLALDPGKSYQWQARAYAADGSFTPANGSGGWWSFSTNPNGTPPFGKLAPTNGATNLPKSVTLQWQTAPGAVDYGYCIDTTLDNRCDRGVDNYIRTSATRVTLTLETNRTYQWQARAYTANGQWTPANGIGQWWSFTTEGTEVSGYLPGEFSVSEAGAATYRIPIALPGGTGGMTPQLALTYDSRGGNTISAWGWSLGGLSAINRCPTTLAQHGFIDGVDFDGNDQFCLDGQLLVAVQGVYGADKTVYRTENESFSKVVSYGKAGNGPAGFKVWTKAGLIMEYGLTDNSRLDAQGRADILFWTVGKIQDTKGNYVVFEYDKNVANGELNPLRINYTGNSTQNLAPYATIEFIYENRPDGRVQYINGSAIRLAKRLQYLRSYVDGALVRELRFGYEVSPTTGRSRLVNLTECGWDGQCLLSTRFTWSSTSTDELNFNAPGSGAWQGHAGGINNNAVGDFNGDGRTDQAGYTGSSGRWHVCLSTGTTFTCDYRVAHSGGVGNNITADFNGDGRADLAGYTGSSGRWHVCLSTGSSFNCNYWVGHSGGVIHNVLADFNGDSLADLASYTGSDGRWHICLSTGADFTCSYWVGHSGGLSNNVAGDFNGDGLTDLAGYTGSSGRWHICLSTGSAFTCSYQIAHSGGVRNNAAGDFNGDGLTDLAGYTGANGQWHVCLSTGVSFTCDYWFGHAGGANNNVMADYNGDGLVDMAGYTGANSLWHVCLSTGAGWGCNNRYWNGHGGGSQNNATGDYNGDGKSDLAGYTGSNGLWHVTLAAGVAPDNLLQITNGHGAQVNVRYAPLTNPAIYSKANDALYPQRDFVAPMYVVEEYSSSNGIGGLHRMTYRYEGLKINLRGRGFLGFAAVKATDTETGIATHTYYHQSHPYKSLVRKVEQFQPDGKLIQRIENTWAVKNFSATAQAAALSEEDARAFYARSEESPTLSTDTTLITTTEQTAIASEDAPHVATPMDAVALPMQSAEVTLPERVYLPLVANLSATVPNQEDADDVETPALPELIPDSADYDFTTFIDTGAVAGEGVNHTSTVDRQVIDSEPPVMALAAFDSTSSDLEQIIAANAQGVTYFPFISQSTVQKFELDGNLIYATTTRTDYDSYGNPITLSESTSDGYHKRTVNSYTNDATKWLLGRLTLAQVAVKATNQPTQTRTAAFAYDAVSGLLTREESEPGTALSLVKSYEYDGFGNIIRSTVSGADITARSQSTEFDSRGRHLLKSKNALGHTESRSYDERLGLPTAITDPNGLIISRSYDSFGRLLRESRPDGTQSTLSYRLCRPGNCPTNVVYYLRTEVSGAAPTVEYFDLLDRTIRREGVGFNGQATYVDTVYNARGQVQKVSTPYFGSDTPLWTDYSYDLIGRTLSETAPNQGRATVEYRGFTTRATNALNQTTSRTVNSQGWLLSSVDAANGTLTYSYDSFGNLLALRDPADNTTTMSYDQRGRKLSLRDPDTGLTQYRYNVLDQLIWQKDAKNQEVTLVYDSLGRLIERREPEGSSRWLYDTAAKGIGKLAEVNGPGGYKESYSYDTLSRPVQTAYTIDGQSFAMRQSYDQYSRVDVLAYPTGFALRHAYNSNGYLSEVRDFANNLPFWQATTANARGQLEGESFRNGIKTTRVFDPKSGTVQMIKSGPANDPSATQNLSYSFDRLGNLTSRTDNRQQLTELFQYDNLNRLTSAKVNSRDAQTVQYDRLGNITFKSDVGTYRYGENGAGPHAVTSIVNGVNATFTYDANGNRITSNAGTITYASFNLPTSINHNNRVVSFAYGPNHARYKETIQVSGVTTTTVFAGGLYERHTVGSRTIHKHYIAGSSGVVAIYYHEPGGPNDYTHYLHRDHLGSIDTITNNVGTVVERLSYDPWGKRRTADWQNVNAAITSLVRRGYTGHEQLDEVGLIHMNGRVYDPTIGRFLSADPFVQAPDFTQSLNRYSYVLNNPLSLTDPSGFFSFGKLIKKIGDFFEDNWKTIASAVVAIAVTIGTAGWGSGVWGAVFSGAAGGFAGNTTGVLLNGGGLPQALQAGLRGAVIGGITAGAFYEIGAAFGHQVDFASATHVKKIIAHGIVGGASEMLQGGKFAHGFLSGAFTQTFAPGIDMIDPNNPGINTYRTMAAAIVGGTAAELGGGKFANGAITGAFSRMFNDDYEAKGNGLFGKKGSLFGRGGQFGRGDGLHGGFFNRNKFLRLGWGWNGREDVFRIAVGNRNTFHTHLDLDIDLLTNLGKYSIPLAIGVTSGTGLTYGFDHYLEKTYGRDATDAAWLQLRDNINSLFH